MSSRRPWWLPLTLLLSLFLPARCQTPATPVPDVLVTGLQGDEVTLNAGANAGIAVGAELRVIRAGTEIGRIVVVRVENTSSTGRWFPYVNRTLSVGDTVVLPAEPPAQPAVAPAPPRKPRPSNPERPSYSEPSRTIIPWESWEYPALSALAVDGLLPGSAAVDFQGTRLYTRGEIAAFVAKAVSNISDAKKPARDAWFLKRLVEAYRHQPPVRSLLDNLPEALTAADTTPPAWLDQVTAWGGLRYQNAHGGNDAEILGRAAGIFRLQDKAWAYLSLNNLHDLTSGLPDGFSELDAATVNFRALDADFTLGKQSLTSGPVYSGDGLLSSNSPGIWQARVTKTFSFGRFGKYTFSQLYGGFPDTERTKYFGLRTVDTSIGKWSIGLAEAYVSTKAPNPLVLVTPYYGYQHWSIFGGDAGSRGNDTFNYMAQVNVAARVRNNMSLYAEFILDDITAPKSWSQGHVPRKVAIVGGMHYPGLLFGGRGDLRVELYQSDRLTYLGVAPQVAWSNRDLMLASPFGPNTQAFFGRLDYRVNDRIKAWMEVHDAVQFHNEYPDMGDRLVNAFGVTWSPRPDRSVYASFIPQRYRGINYAERRATFDLVASFAF
jgi:hypothetical protein